MSRTTYHYLLLFIGPIFLLCTSVNATPPPKTLTGGKVINAEEVLKLQKKASIFDQRKAINYGRGHIPTAKYLPCANETNCINLSQLPKDKNVLLIFYSQGVTDSKSYYAAKQAITAGYRNVNWFREGYSSWVAKKYPVEF
jgi:rhodanese-related sulfurtransferase